MNNIEILKPLLQEWDGTSIHGSCPTCRWEPPSDDLMQMYIVIKQPTNKYKCFIITNYWIRDLTNPRYVYIENTRIIEQIEEKIYPVRCDFTSRAPEGLPPARAVDWTETHFCPRCEKEYSFRNGT